jgi:hypothetical protein
MNTWTDHFSFLRKKTSVSNNWITAQLNMGASQAVSRYVSKLLGDQKGQGVYYENHAQTLRDDPTSSAWESFDLSFWDRPCGRWWRSIIVSSCGTWPETAQLIV